MEPTARKSQLQLRISSEDKALIQKAADATGLDVAAFALLHTKKAAEEVVAGRRFFTLTDVEYAEFLARLDEPAKVLSGLQELVAKPSPFSADETKAHEQQKSRRDRQYEMLEATVVDLNDESDPAEVLEISREARKHVATRQAPHPDLKR